MTITHKELMRRLRRLQRAITEHVAWPNHGGCAVIAGIVGEHLRDLGFDVEIVTPVNKGALFETKPAAEVRNNLPAKWSWNHWDENGLSRAHLAVRFRSGGRCYTWDSETLLRKAGWFGRASTWTGWPGKYQTSAKFGDGMTVDECNKLASTGKGWNTTFDRKQIPTIRTLADYHLRLGLN